MKKMKKIFALLIAMGNGTWYEHKRIRCWN